MSVETNRLLPARPAGALANPLWRTAARLASGRAAARRLGILIFHRVVAQPDPLFPGEMHAARFEALCAWLAACFQVLPLDMAVRLLRTGHLPARALAITFDDGYADNHDQALPILQRHGLPATVFVATGFLDGGRMFNDTVIESLRRAPGTEVDLGVLGTHGIGRRPLRDAGERVQAIDAVLRAIKHLPPPERQAWVQEVHRRCGSPSLPDDLMMRSEQVHALHRAGLQIGAHTRSHPILATLDEAGMRDEILRGRAELESIIGEPVRMFAYPNGRPGHDYSATSVRIVREAGFEFAVSTAWGAAERSSDPLQLPRFTPWDRDLSRFGARLLMNLRRRQAARV